MAMNAVDLQLLKESYNVAAGVGTDFAHSYKQPSPNISEGVYLYVSKRDSETALVRW